MRSTRTVTSLALAAAITAAAPSAAGARPIDVPPAAPDSQQCFQLNPIAPGQERGVHRVLCGPSGDDRPAVVSDLHPAQSGSSWDEIALLVAAAGLTLSTVGLATRRRSPQRRSRPESIGG
jgi:hypothetical protein